MKIYLDMDGTITNIFPRYYQIIQDFFCIKEDMYKDYVVLKRLYEKDGIVLEKLLGNAIDIEKYKKYKKEKLEDFNYLKIDTLLINLNKLNDFLKNNEVSILSCRNNIKNAKKQINYLNIDIVKEKIHFIKPNGINSKLDFLKDEKEPFIMVGDSEIDMQVNKYRNAKTVFVKTGLRQENKLIVKPTKIFDNINDFIDWYENEGRLFK